MCAAFLSIGVRLHKTWLNMLNRNSHYTGGLTGTLYLETLPNPDSSTSTPARSCELTHFLTYFCKLTLSVERWEGGREEGGVCVEMTFYFLQTKNDDRGGQSSGPAWPQCCRRWVLMCLFSLSFITVKICNLPERRQRSRPRYRGNHSYH